MIQWSACGQGTDAFTAPRIRHISSYHRRRRQAADLLYMTSSERSLLPFANTSFGRYSHETRSITLPALSKYICVAKAIAR